MLLSTSWITHRARVPGLGPNGLDGCTDRLAQALRKGAAHSNHLGVLRGSAPLPACSRTNIFLWARRREVDPRGAIMEELVVRLLPLRRLPFWLRYSGSTLLVGTATLLRMGLHGSLHDYSFYLFLPAVFLSAFGFGRGAAYWAIGLSLVLSVGLFTEPYYSLVVRHDDVIPLVLFLATCVGITEVTEALRRVLDRTARAEQENGLLLQELEHRTKNDLQMVASVLGLQANSHTDPAVKAALKSAVGRIQVIAQAHERLQRRDPGAVVRTDDYLRDLCHGLGELLRDVRPIVVSVDAERIELPTSVAVPLGLLTNELVTNAFKYAFPDNRGGTIRVSLKRVDTVCAELSVSDDGIGCSDSPRQGLGTRLTALLSRQLGGTIARDTASPGCRILITFPLDYRSGARQG